LECGLRVLLRMYMDHNQVPAPSIRCLAMNWNQIFQRCRSKPGMTSRAFVF